MKTICNRTDLEQQSKADPVYPILDELVRVIMDADPTYNPEHRGYIVLIEEGDKERPLSDIGWDEYALKDLH
jgi:hypothetical protein